MNGKYLFAGVIAIFCLIPAVMAAQDYVVPNQSDLPKAGDTVTVPGSFTNPKTGLAPEITSVEPGQLYDVDYTYPSLVKGRVYLIKGKNFASITKENQVGVRTVVWANSPVGYDTKIPPKEEDYIGKIVPVAVETSDPNVNILVIQVPSGIGLKNNNEYLIWVNNSYGDSNPVPVGYRDI